MEETLFGTCAYVLYWTSYIPTLLHFYSSSCDHNCKAFNLALNDECLQCPEVLGLNAYQAYVKLT